MRRRSILSFVGCAALLSPRLTRAQPAATPVIGFLHPGSFNSFAPLVAAFHEGLKEAGYTDGHNVSIEYRWAEGQYDRLPALATELVRQRVALIATPGSTPATLAAKAATSAIPIVFAVGSDPVELGLVASIGRPGGTMTGVSMLTAEMTTKRLEVLHDLVPRAGLTAVLRNPISPTAGSETASVNAAARLFGRQVLFLDAGADHEIDAAFATMRADVLLVLPDAFFISRRDNIAALAARKSVPAIYHRREFVQAGGLVSYGDRLADAYRQAGVYAGRILKGAKPAELPVLQPTKFELVVNLKAAKALGLTIPHAMLLRADEVIE